MSRITAFPAEILPEVIQAVYDALGNVKAKASQASKLEPAVPVKKSVFPDYIICLEAVSER
jgi:predicted transcriptional regulator